MQYSFSPDKFSPEQYGRAALTVARVTAAVLILIHATHRLFDDEYSGLGGVFDALPFYTDARGVFLAKLATLLELVGAPLIATGRFVFPLSLVFIFMYTLGIYLYHSLMGWFASIQGVDGCEYPLLYIIIFLGTAIVHFPSRAAGGGVLLANRASVAPVESGA